jgi:predicted N-acetyltransferase YhbS
VSSAIRVVALDAPPPEFRSGRVELDAWLSRYALQATRVGSARVFLAYEREELVGYFALAAGEVQHEHADARTRSGMPRHPIPVVLLARLAVAEAAQGRGIGRELVWHAAALSLRASRLIAVRALVVDAIDEETAGFYERVGFKRLAPGALRLRMLVKDLERLAAEK